MNYLGTLKSQLQKNLLALISIVIAVVALSYNSWRNELSEDNRTIREAGFEILKESAKLQFYVDNATYGNDYQQQEHIQGWVSVNFIISLSGLISPEIQSQSESLKKVWSENSTKLANEQTANQKISEENTKLVDLVRLHLKQLK